MNNDHKYQVDIAEAFDKLAKTHNEIVQKLRVFGNLMELNQEQLNELIAPLYRLYENTDHLYESIHKEGSAHEKIRKFINENLDIQKRSS